MDLMRTHLLILLFFGVAFLVYQLQFADAQEDLNVISSMVSPGLDPRQVVNEEINDKRMEDLRNQNFNVNLEEG